MLLWQPSDCITGFFMIDIVILLYLVNKYDDDDDDSTNQFVKFSSCLIWTGSTVPLELGDDIRLDLKRTNIETNSGL